MNFNDLSLEQINKLSIQLRDYFVWLKLVEFVKKLYGTSAYQINIGIDGIWDDEGSTNWIIDSLYVSDKNENELDLNCRELSKYYQIIKYRNTLDCEDEDNVNEMFHEVVYSFFGYNFISEDNDLEFYVDKPPKMDYKITIESLDTAIN